MSQRHETMQPGHACPTCSYDVGGMPASSRCPECGTPLTSIDAQRPAAKTTRGPLCRKCSYDLTGLPMGGRCPECATPIPIRTRRVLADNLAHAPTWYLRWLTAGSISTVIGGLGGMISLLMVAGQHSWHWIVPFACLIVWAAGVWIVTRPHESSIDQRTDFVRQGRVSRWTARLTQWGWAAGVGLAWAATEVELTALAAGTPVDDALVRGLFVASWVCLGIGVVGLVPVCTQLSALAEWAGAEWTGEWMRGASIALVLAFPMIAASLLMGSTSIVTVVAGVFGVIMAVGAAGLLAVGVVQVAAMSLWAMRASSETIERDQRTADRLDRETKRFVQRTKHIGEASPIDAAAPLGIPRGPTRTTPPVGRGQDPDLSPIEMEPDRAVGKKTIRYERPGE